MKRLFLFIVAMTIAAAASAQESYVQVPPDSTGKKIRHYQATIGGNTVYIPGNFLSTTGGTEIGLVGSPIFVEFTDGVSAYVAAKASQLPSALVGGRLDVNVGNTPSVTISGTPSVANQQTNVTADYDTSGATQNVTLFGVAIPKSGGAVAGGTSSDPFRIDPTGTTTQPVSAASLPLPTGAATESTLVGIKAGTDKIPSSPATDRTTAAAPSSNRLSDGSAFYDAAKTGQLPAALDGSGFLKVHEQGTATVSGTVTSNIGTTNGLALDATLTGGTQKSIARGGAKGATTAADVTSTANGADHQGLDVQVQNASITVAGTVTTTPPSNASTNVTQLNGTTVDTNSGTKSAGTIRVVIATDQPTNTNALKVDGSAVTQPVSAAALPLPSGAAQEHTTAGSPSSMRLTDGGSFYDARSIRALTSSDVVDVSDRSGRALGAIANTGFNVNNSPTVNQGTAAATTAGWPSITGTVAAATAAWTSATSTDTAISISTTGYSTALFSYNPSGTISGGAITFEISDDGGTTWYLINAVRTDTFMPVTAFTLGSTKFTYVIPVSGATTFRIRLNPTVSGTGTANVRIQASAAARDPYTSSNVALLNGNTLQVGNGTSTGGTQRVTLASDSTGQVTLAAGTATIGSAKITDGTNTAVVKAASTAAAAADPSVVTAFSPNSPLPTGSNVIGALSSNQSVNVAQINAVTPLMGNGTTGTGSQRVTIASDNTPFAIKTDQTTHGTTDLVADDITKIAGTAVVNGGLAGTLAIGGTGANNASITQNPDLIGVEALSTQPTAATTGNLRRLVGTLDGALFVREGGPINWTCGLNALAATLTQCQAAPGAGVSLYITDIVVQTTTATSGTYSIQTGTGSNCATGTAALFPVSGTANRWNAPTNAGAATNFNFKIPLKAPANSAVCVIGVATNTISIQINGFTAP